MRRKHLSSVAAVAGVIGTLFLGTAVEIDAALASQSCAPPRDVVRQPFLSGGGESSIAYAPPAAAAAAGDYLADVSKNGMHRWAAERMPLKVYIEEGVCVPGYRSSMKQLLVKSFDEWCRISNGKLSWREVSSPDQADIVCNYSDTPRKAGPRGFEAGVTNTIIQQNRYTGQSSIVSATMTILTQWRGRQFNDSEIYMTALHEVGHAMGMQGHSNEPSDLMYSTVNRQQTPVLTQRDANTIAKLYRSYGTEPAVAYSPRGRSGGFPQMAPRFAGGYNGVGGASGADAGSFNNANGSTTPDGSRIVQAEGLQPFTPVEPQQGRYHGRDRFNYLSGDAQGASGGFHRGFANDGFGQTGPGFGENGVPRLGGQRIGRFDSGEPGFNGPGPGQNWRAHRRARWRNLDPARRAAIMQRMQQAQGFMPNRGYTPGQMVMQDQLPYPVQPQYQDQIPDGYFGGRPALIAPSIGEPPPNTGPDAGASSPGVGGLLQQLFGL